MSTKQWISNQNKFGIYQECPLDIEGANVKANPAVIQIEQPEECIIAREKSGKKDCSALSVSIPVEVMV